jgi:hypothetical protein
MRPGQKREDCIPHEIRQLLKDDIVLFRRSCKRNLSIAAFVRGADSSRTRKKVCRSVAVSCSMARQLGLLVSISRYALAGAREVAAESRIRSRWSSFQFQLLFETTFSSA